MSTTRWTVVAATGTAALAAAPSGTSATAAQDLMTDADNANQAFYNYLFIICASLVVVMVAWRITSESVKYVRTLTCLNNSTQRYFSKPSDSFATFKEYLLYAPVFRKRHNREFQLSTAVNIGTLPTRLQLLFLIAYFATNITFCVTSIDWDQDFATISEEIRNRSGILAVVNLVPLFIMSARNNPLIIWLNMSYDTFNLLHRWFGRIVVLEIMVHTGAWVAATVHKSGWLSVTASVRTSQMLMFGFIVSPSNNFHTILRFRKILLIRVWSRLEAFGIELIKGIMSNYNVGYCSCCCYQRPVYVSFAARILRNLQIYPHSSDYPIASRYMVPSSPRPTTTGNNLVRGGRHLGDGALTPHCETLLSECRQWRK
jgi:hypothetical protein